MDDGGIQKFFSKREMSKEDYSEDTGIDEPGSDPWPGFTRGTSQEIVVSDFDGQLSEDCKATKQDQRRESPDTYLCTKCNIKIIVDERPEHEDWHFAKNLAASERTADTVHVHTPSMSKKTKSTRPQKGPKKPGGGTHGEKGQSKLAFGR